MLKGLGRSNFSRNPEMMLVIVITVFILSTWNLESIQWKQWFQHIKVNQPFPNGRFQRRQRKHTLNLLKSTKTHSEEVSSPQFSGASIETHSPAAAWFFKHRLSRPLGPCATSNRQLQTTRRLKSSLQTRKTLAAMRIFPRNV